MHAIDWFIIAGYFGLLLGVAWWVIRRGKSTTDDYFLAGRGLGWFIVGASIFSSNIGSEHLVGLAGSGCKDGVAMAHYELHAWCLLMLGWIMVPFYMRSRVYTMPEFLERRFSRSSRYVLSVISLIAYIVTKVAVGIFAGGIVFSALLPELRLDLGGLELNSFWIGSVLSIVLTGVYTVLGGLRAVAYTEALQTVILVVGSLLVTVFGLAALGGWTELREICGADAFNLWKPLSPEGVAATWSPVIERDDAGDLVRQAWYFNGDFPWLGMLFCAPIIGLWYWCTDQYIVQRALGARNATQARRGSIFASLLKLLPVFVFIIPGMICFALAKSGRNAALQSELFPDGTLIAENAQAAFPLMVQTVLPVGVRGIVVAGLLSALMSSLAGVFNASSTLFTMDLYKPLKPRASEGELVWVGRLATTAMVLLGLAWVPVIQGARGLYYYLQGVQGYLAPPIFVVFFFGVFSRRLNARGCLWALMVGFTLGLFRLAVDTPVALQRAGFEEGYTEGSFLWVINNIYFQYYSLCIFLVSAVVLVLVSYTTHAPAADSIHGLTYATMSDQDRQATRGSWGMGDVIASVATLLAILAAYLYFSG